MRCTNNLVMLTQSAPNWEFVRKFEVTVDTIWINHTLTVNAGVIRNFFPVCVCIVKDFRAITRSISLADNTLYW